MTASALSPSARCGDRGDDGRVDAAGERDDDAAELGDAASSRRVTRTSCAAASACAQTTFTGAPLMRAARSQSACSGARFTTRPSSLPTFTRTGSPPTSTVKLSRSSSIRSRWAIRTPSVLVSRSIASATARSSCGRASADSTKPGRPRFICDRRGPDVERAGREAGRGGVGRELGEQVVEVGLDQRDARRSTASRAEDHAHDVRQRLRGRACRRRSPSPRAVIARDRAVRVGERGDQRRAGRRDQLHLDVDAVQRRALEQRRASPARAAAAGRARRRRTRVRRAAASRRRGRCRATRARARRRRPRRSRRPRRPRGSAPARARSRGSRPSAMREPLERRLRARASGARGASAASICVADRAPSAGAAAPGAPCTVTVVARDPVPLGRAELERSPSTPSRRSSTVRARVEQRAEQHVAGDAADAVDVEDHAAQRRVAAAARSAPRSSPRRTRRRCSRPPRPPRTRSASPAARSRRRTSRRSPCSSAPRSPARPPARRPPTRAPRPSRRRRPRSPRAADRSAPARAGAGRPRPRPDARPPSSRATRPAPAPRVTTGPSDVPPETIVTRPLARRHVARHPRQPRPLVLLGVGGDAAQRRPSAPRRRASRARCPRRRRAARGAIAAISSGVLPSATIASGAP